MNSKGVIGSSGIAGLAIRQISARIWPAPWEMVAFASLVASVGGGWAVLARQAGTPSPFLVALTMMLATFGGWYVWAFFTHLVDTTLFGGHASYQELLDAFAHAYVFQSLSLFAFTFSLGWLWTWAAFYFTIVAWGVVGPRRLGMRTYQAIVSATLGMLMWLACLLVLILVMTRDGLYVDIGAILA
jgi:hypothetical protein